MIVLRRLLTVPLGFLLFLLLLVSIVVLQAGGTFLDPDFYPSELRKADFYNFLLLDVTTSALDEARELDVETLPKGLDQNPLVALDLSTEEIVTSVNTAIPPEWVQATVEQVFDELGGYLAGKRDGFEVTIQAGDQVVTMVSEVKTLLRRADFYNLMFEDLVNPAIEDALAEGLPLGLSISADQLEASVRTIVPREWIQAQLEATLDEVTPYAIGDRDDFEIRVPLSDRAAIAIEEVKRLLREADAYNLLYDDVVEPSIRDVLGESVQLPFEIVITTEEVISAMREVAPPAWVQAQAEAIIDEASPYLTGEVNEFAVTVSLAENKAEAARILEDLTNRKVSERLEGLSGSPAAERLRQELIRGAGNIVEALGPFILDVIPDDLTFMEVDLRDALAQEGTGRNLELLDDVREIIRDGWAYTEIDLREDVRKAFADGGDGDDAVETMDDIRAFLADGWTYTEVDFREDLGDQETLDSLDTFRSVFGWAKRLQLLLFLPTLVVLVAIGFLGGRNWSSRVAWAAGALAIVSAVIFIGFGPVFSTLANSPYENLREDAISDVNPTNDFDGTLRLVINKGFDMGESIIDDFSSGVTTRAVILFVIGLIALGVSLGWDTITGLVRRVRSQGL